jgi:hypothetical protein
MVPCPVGFLDSLPWGSLKTRLKEALLATTFPCASVHFRFSDDCWPQAAEITTDTSTHASIPTLAGDRMILLLCERIQEGRTAS